VWCFRLATCLQTSEYLTFINISISEADSRFCKWQVLRKLQTQSQGVFISCYLCSCAWKKNSSLHMACSKRATIFLLPKVHAIWRLLNFVHAVSIDDTNNIPNFIYVHSMNKIKEPPYGMLKKSHNLFFWLL
jgi:hypothetical protein